MKSFLSLGRRRIFPDFKTEIGENLMVGYAFV
jgi:hypothetical protein